MPSAGRTGQIFFRSQTDERSAASMVPPNNQPSNCLSACRAAIALSVPPNALTHLLGRKQIVDYWGSLSCRFPLSRKSSPNLPLPASRNATAAAK